MKRRMLVFMMMAIAGAVCLTQDVKADDAKPNIIFVLLDDLGKEWIGCYGAEGIETPRIDEPVSYTHLTLPTKA